MSIDAKMKVKIKAQLEYVPGLRGDVSGLRGDVSGIWGDVSGLVGDASGIFGDASEIKIILGGKK